MMSPLKIIPLSLSLTACAGCLSFGYLESVDEDFEELDTEAELRAAISSGRNLIARYLFLTDAPHGGEGVLPIREDNLERQVKGKQKNFADRGSYVRKPDMWNFSEVRLVGGKLEVWINGYLVTTTEGGVDASTKWVGFQGRERYREIRVKMLPSDITLEQLDAVPPMSPPDGFEPLFTGAPAQLSQHWHGVTPNEKFDNPLVRAAATPEKCAALQQVADRDLAEHWTVRNGVLHFDGLKGGYSIATRRKFQDFELWVDWRLLSLTGDSGLFLRGCPQVQIWDAHHQWDIGSGGLYNNDTEKSGNPRNATSIADSRIGDWNRFHIIMRGDKVSVSLNGQLVVDRVRLENYWDKKRPVPISERIELQSHGDPVEWGNIYIRELPTPKVSSERVGVCSWSWRLPLKDVAAEMEKSGVRGIHLALGPFINPDDRHGAAAAADDWQFVKDQISSGKWQLMSTMVATIGEDYSTLETIRRTGGIVPDATWSQNQAIVREGARRTRELGCRWMSLHAGFLDESDPAAYSKYLERVQWMRDCAAEYGVSLILESGQETAADLVKFLAEVPGVYVNFDPANMVLYGKGDPAEAVKLLLPYIRQIHAKDAIYTSEPGTWGSEVPWGEGVVNGKNFIELVESLGYEGNYVIEREGGRNRIRDINLAIERLVK